MKGLKGVTAKSLPTPALPGCQSQRKQIRRAERLCKGLTWNKLLLRWQSNAQPYVSLCRYLLRNNMDLNLVGQIFHFIYIDPAVKFGTPGFQTPIALDTAVASGLNQIPQIFYGTSSEIHRFSFVLKAKKEPQTALCHCYQRTRGDCAVAIACN